MKTSTFARHFLIAMPGMVDPNFSRTLTYVCEHNDSGALGLVVNRPTDITLGSLFEQIQLPLQDPELSREPVYFGGPVHTDRGFVLHRPLGAWKSTLVIDSEIGLTTSKDILEAMSDHRLDGQHLIALGYAGWAPGQLEDEIRRNGWLTVEADLRYIFSKPASERLEAAMACLGVNYANLSEVAGHA